MAEKKLKEGEYFEMCTLCESRISTFINKVLSEHSFVQVLSMGAFALKSRVEQLQ